jgi:hypothetical protein
MAKVRAPGEVLPDERAREAPRQVPNPEHARPAPLDPHPVQADLKTAATHFEQRARRSLGSHPWDAYTPGGAAPTSGDADAFLPSSKDLWGVPRAAASARLHYEAAKLGDARPDPLVPEADFLDFPLDGRSGPTDEALLANQTHVYAKNAALAQQSWKLTDRDAQQDRKPSYWVGQARLAELGLKIALSGPVSLDHVFDNAPVQAAHAVRVFRALGQPEAPFHGKSISEWGKELELEQGRRFQQRLKTSTFEDVGELRSVAKAAARGAVVPGGEEPLSGAELHRLKSFALGPRGLHAIPESERTFRNEETQTEHLLGFPRTAHQRPVGALGWQAVGDAYAAWAGKPDLLEFADALLRPAPPPRFQALSEADRAVLLGLVAGRPIDTGSIDAAANAVRLGNLLGKGYAERLQGAARVVEAHNETAASAPAQLPAVLSEAAARAADLRDGALTEAERRWLKEPHQAFETVLEETLRRTLEEASPALEAALRQLHPGLGNAYSLLGAEIRNVETHRPWLKERAGSAEDAQRRRAARLESGSFLDVAELRSFAGGKDATPQRERLSRLVAAHDQLVERVRSKALADAERQWQKSPSGPFRDALAPALARTLVETDEQWTSLFADEAKGLGNAGSLLRADLTAAEAHRAWSEKLHLPNGPEERARQERRLRANAFLSAAELRAYAAGAARAEAPPLSVSEEDVPLLRRVLKGERLEGAGAVEPPPEGWSKLSNEQRQLVTHLLGLGPFGPVVPALPEAVLAAQRIDVTALKMNAAAKAVSAAEALGLPGTTRFEGRLLDDWRLEVDDYNARADNKTTLARLIAEEAAQASSVQAEAARRAERLWFDHQDQDFGEVLTRAYDDVSRRQALGVDSEGGLYLPSLGNALEVLNQERKVSAAHTTWHRQQVAAFDAEALRKRRRLETHQFLDVEEMHQIAAKAPKTASPSLPAFAPASLELLAKHLAGPRDLSTVPEAERTWEGPKDSYYGGLRYLLVAPGQVMTQRPGATRWDGPLTQNDNRLGQQSPLRALERSLLQPPPPPEFSQLEPSQQALARSIWTKGPSPLDPTLPNAAQAVAVGRALGKFEEGVFHDRPLTDWVARIAEADATRADQASRLERLFAHVEREGEALHAAALARAIEESRANPATDFRTSLARSLKDAVEGSDVEATLPLDLRHLGNAPALVLALLTSPAGQAAWVDAYCAGAQSQAGRLAANAFLHAAEVRALATPLSAAALSLPKVIASVAPQIAQFFKSEAAARPPELDALNPAMQAVLRALLVGDSAGPEATLKNVEYAVVLGHDLGIAGSTVFRGKTPEAWSELLLKRDARLGEKAAQLQALVAHVDERREAIQDTAVRAAEERWHADPSADYAALLEASLRKAIAGASAELKESLPRDFPGLGNADAVLRAELSDLTNHRNWLEQESKDPARQAERRDRRHRAHAFIDADDVRDALAAGDNTGANARTPSDLPAVRALAAYLNDHRAAWQEEAAAWAQRQWAADRTQRYRDVLTQAVHDLAAERAQQIPEDVLAPVAKVGNAATLLLAEAAGLPTHRAFLAEREPDLAFGETLSAPTNDDAALPLVTVRPDPRAALEALSRVEEARHAQGRPREPVLIALQGEPAAARRVAQDLAQQRGALFRQLDGATFARPDALDKALGETPDARSLLLYLDEPGAVEPHSPGFATLGAWTRRQGKPVTLVLAGAKANAAPLQELTSVRQTLSIGPLSQEQVAQLLFRHAHEEGYQLSDEACRAFAEQCRPGDYAAAARLWERVKDTQLARALTMSEELTRQPRAVTLVLSEDVEAAASEAA